MLDEYKYLTSDANEFVSSVAIEARRNLGVSFESSLLWIANRDIINNGMHWHHESEKKYSYLSLTATYTVDFKNFQVYLGKMNRAYKFWTVLNMYGLDSVKSMLKSKLSTAQSLSSQM